MATTGDDTILRDVAALVPELADVDDLQIVPLPGGLSNRNYVVGTGDSRFVIRVAGDNTAILGADRTMEKAVLEIVEAAGITPPVAAFVLPGGHAATRFLPDAHALSIDEFTSPEMVPRIAAVLRRVHGLGRVEGVFDPYTDIDRWMRRLEATGTPLPSRLAPLLDLVEESKALRPRPPEAGMTLCHNDPYHLNFLDDGKLWLIDWEYAGMNDPMYDLAGIGYTLDDAGRELLLESYFGTVTPGAKRALEALMPTYLCWNVVWSLVQIDGGIADFDYFAYAGELLDWMPGLRR